MRYEKKATIVTSNKNLTEWGHALHEGYGGHQCRSCFSLTVRQGRR